MDKKITTDKTMIEASASRLQYLCNTIPDLLNTIREEELSYSSAPGKWSKKQILGHLIDSATNNHQRFLRIQFEDMPSIVYDQNNWNRYSYYNELKASHLVAFWKIYNLHLLELIRRIPAENLQRLCTVGEKKVTLQFLIDDYVEHMEHHLKQLVAYN